MQLRTTHDPRELPRSRDASRILSRLLAFVSLDPDKWRVEAQYCGRVHLGLIPPKPEDGPWRAIEAFAVFDFYEDGAEGTGWETWTADEIARGGMRVTQVKLVDQSQNPERVYSAREWRRMIGIERPGR